MEGSVGPRERVVNAAVNAINRDQYDIANMGLNVVAMLLEKNAAYGSSVFNPISVFARGMDPLDQIHVRMDDKLARLKMGHEISDESSTDTIRDLAGYCIIELVARERLCAAPNADPGSNASLMGDPTKMGPGSDGGDSVTTAGIGGQR